MVRITSSVCRSVVMENEALRSFTEIGMIAHHFEQCEFELSVMFQILCEAENDAPFEIFGQIVSSNMRLGMTRTALAQCLPRPSAIKSEVERLLNEFSACQTLRNRAIHQSIQPQINGDRLEFIGRPLWHQTMRYKDGALKPGLENGSEALRETNFRCTILVFEMRGAVTRLEEFLAKRRQRRRSKRRLEPARRKGAG